MRTVTVGLVGLVGLVLLASGCAAALPTGVGDAPLTVRGAIRDGSGQAASGVEVKAGPAGGTPTAMATTDGGGGFDMGLRSAAASGDMAISATRPDGATVYHRFPVKAGSVNLPALRFWDGLASPAAGAETGEMVPLRWSAVEAAAGYTVAIRDAAGASVWSRRTTTNWLDVPAYVLDARATYRWSVAAELPGGVATTAPRDFTAMAGANAAEAPIVAVGDERARSWPHLVDGQVVPGPRGATGAREVVLDLGFARPLSRLVVYGASLPALVKVQAAATPGQWGLQIAAFKDGDADLDLNGVSARYLRLSSAREVGFANVAELRVIALGPARQ